jgi:hypothetical protein
MIAEEGVATLPIYRLPVVFNSVLISTESAPRDITLAKASHHSLSTVPTLPPTRCISPRICHFPYTNQSLTVSPCISPVITYKSYAIARAPIRTRNPSEVLFHSYI